MNPLLRKVVNFRSRQETEKSGGPDRSIAGKIAAPLAGAAAVGGFYLYHATRPDAVKHRTLMRGHNYTEGLRTQPAPKTAPKYSDGGFDYGVKPVVAKPVAAPKAPTQPAAVLVKQAVRKPTSIKTKAPASTVKAKLKAGWALSPKVPAANVVKVGMNARLLLIGFQDRNRDGTMGVSVNPLTAYRKASRVVPWVHRGAEAAGDIGDIASGKTVKDPFYKKPWFKRAAVTTAVAAPLLAASLARSGERKIADHVPVRTGAKFGDKVDRLTRKAAVVKGKVTNSLGLSRKNPLAVALEAHARLVEFASGDALDKGWDLRDARGRSARVYAPGSRRRERREKDWGEKTSNIRLVRNVAIAGTLAGIAGTLAYRNKAQKLTPKVPAVTAPDNVIRGVFPKPKTA